MINDYEIQKVGNEEILYIYLNFDTEFAKLKGKKKKKKINAMVEDFLKTNNIKFNGKKVAVVVGGVLVTTLIVGKTALQQPKSPELKYDNYTISLVDESFINNLKNEELNKKEEIIEEKKEDEVKPEIKKEQVNKPSTSTTNKKTPIKSSKPKNPVSTPSTPVVPKEELKPTPPPHPEVDNNTYVTIKRSNGAMVTLELEEYVIGVVGAEMPASFHLEALKAQAIIARTYALKALETGKMLTDNSSTQNYKNNDELKKVWGNSFNTYYNKIKNAVDSTKGMYLTYNGAIIEAVYHSTSNGKTEDAKYVWGNSFPYLIPVDSPTDSSNSSFLKTQFMTYSDISLKLGFEVNQDTEFNILSRTTGDRIENIKIGNNVLTGVVLRNTLGLRSADITIQKTDTGINFTTKGFGHGVGMSQYGANGMAKNGSNFESILKHYYTGVTLSKRS